MNVHQRIVEMTDLARIYAEDGAFISAAVTLRKLAAELEQRAKETREPKRSNKKWIPWNSGPPPVPSDAIIDIRLKDDTEMHGFLAKGFSPIRWGGFGIDGNPDKGIKAYRLSNIRNDKDRFTVNKAGQKIPYRK